MEAILKDARRGKRSFLGVVHAVSGAFKHSIAGSGYRGRARYRAIGEGKLPRDVYGREGKFDIYYSREMVELYRAMPFHG